MIVSSTPSVFESQPARKALGISSLLPREHGSWALALEPLALALIAAPSWRGGALAIAAVAVFLMRRPFQLLRAAGAPAHAPLPAAVLAGLGGLAMILSVFACAGVLASVSAPLVIAGFAGAIFAWFDARREGRELAAELCGVAFFAALATAVACLGDAGTSRFTVFAVAAFCGARGVTSVLPIRTLLRRRKGYRVSRIPALVAAAFAVLACGFASAAVHNWVPLAWSLVFAIRTLWFVGPRAPRMSARRLGFTEAGLGVAAVLTTGISLS